jgi:glucose-1-phosphate adenylyltransferase
MDYQPFLDHHRALGADLSIAVQPVTAEQAPRLGILGLDEQGFIREWVEKPSDPVVLKGLRSGDDPERPYLASMGIYIFRGDLLRRLLNQIAEPDFGEHIVPQAISCCKVSAFVFDGFWADIGTIRSFYEVNLLLTHPGMPFSFYDEAYPIFTHPRFLPPTRVDNCKLEHVLVAEGCKVRRASISESVLGVRSVIGANTRVVRTMMMGADYYDTGDMVDPSGKLRPIPLGIGEGSQIEGAILDKNVRIGAKVTVRSHPPGTDLTYPPGCKPGEEMYVIRDGIVVIPKNSEIPPGTVI